MKLSSCVNECMAPYKMIYVVLYYTTAPNQWYLQNIDGAFLPIYVKIETTDIKWPLWIFESVILGGCMTTCHVNGKKLQLLLELSKWATFF